MSRVAPTAHPVQAIAADGTGTIDPQDPAQDQFVEEDLLVEDVSIDGMCGVY